MKIKYLKKYIKKFLEIFPLRINCCFLKIFRYLSETLSVFSKKNSVNAKFVNYRIFFIFVKKSF